MYACYWILNQQYARVFDQKMLLQKKCLSQKTLLSAGKRDIGKYSCWASCCDLQYIHNLCERSPTPCPLAYFCLAQNNTSVYWEKERRRGFLDGCFEFQFIHNMCVSNLPYPSTAQFFVCHKPYFCPKRGSECRGFLDWLLRLAIFTKSSRAIELPHPGLAWILV